MHTPQVTTPAALTLTVVGPTHPFWVSAHEFRNMRDLEAAERAYNDLIKL